MILSGKYRSVSLANRKCYPQTLGSLENFVKILKTISNFYLFEYHCVSPSVFAVSLKRNLKGRTFKKPHPPNPVVRDSLRRRSTPSELSQVISHREIIHLRSERIISKVCLSFGECHLPNDEYLLLGIGASALNIMILLLCLI